MCETVCVCCVCVCVFVCVCVCVCVCVVLLSTCVKNVANIVLTECRELSPLPMSYEVSINCQQCNA